MSTDLAGVIGKVVGELSRAVFGPAGYQKRPEPDRGQDALLKDYRRTEVR